MAASREHQIAKALRPSYANLILGFCVTT